MGKGRPTTAISRVIRGLVFCCPLGCADIQVDPLPILLKTFVDASEHLFLARQPLAHGNEHVGQLCARKGRGFDHLSEESARVVWCSGRQLLLEAPKCADLVHKGKVATKVLT